MLLCRGFVRSSLDGTGPAGSWLLQREGLGVETWPIAPVPIDLSTSALRTRRSGFSAHPVQRVLQGRRSQVPLQSARRRFFLLLVRDQGSCRVEMTDRGPPRRRR